MKMTFNLILICLISAVCLLSGCNTSQGLSQDINQTSDTIHRELNS